MSKRRRCLYCKDYFDMTEMVKIKVGWFCCHEHIAQYAADRQRKQAEKTRKRAQVERKRQYRDNDLRHQMKLCVEAVHAYVKYRDRFEPCISCGIEMGKWDAGHYRSVGACKELRLYPLNIHKQCFQCNGPKGSNAVEYRIRLVRKIGLVMVERLEEANGVTKQNIDVIKGITAHYKPYIKLWREFYRESIA